jgi:hypothetical protein
LCYKLTLIAIKAIGMLTKKANRLCYVLLTVK